MKKHLIVDIITGLLIFLFVYTAVSKLINIHKFQAALQQSPLIGDRTISLSWTIPITELAISLLLFLPRFRRWGLMGAFVLMMVFTCYITYMLLYTPQLPCSCGGVISQMSWKQHLVFNICFTLLALIGILLYKKEFKAGTSAQYHIA